MDFVNLSGFSWMPTVTMALPDDKTHYPGGNVQESIYRLGHWAKEESFIVCTVMKQCVGTGVFLDIGANTGYFSLLALGMQCQVIAVEPNEIHKQYFMASAVANNFDSKMYTFHQDFISNKPMALFDGWSSVEHIADPNFLRPIKTTKVINLTSSALLTKIDVEGAEPDVIKSMYPNIRDGLFPYIMFELTYIINNTVDALQAELMDSLNLIGYTLYEIIPESLRLITDTSDFIEIKYFEYIHHHKAVNTSITNAGTNILAIHRSVSSPPFRRSLTGFSLF